MKILYLGDLVPLRGPLEALRDCSGFDLVLRFADGEHADVVIDNASASAVELRARMSALTGRVGHYVLLSSHRVYPTAPRLRPWRAEELDVCTDFFPSLPEDVAAARALERELRVAAAATGMPFSIVRPAPVDAPDAATGTTRWFARRVAQGGLVVLPEGDLGSYALIGADELARALVAVAGDPRAFGATLNVANQAVLGYWGHAAMVRDALALPLRFGYVPQWRWRAAGLSLPMGEAGGAGFMASSPLLAELGWHADDPVERVYSVARLCHAGGGLEMDAAMRLERQVLAESEREILYAPGEAGAFRVCHDTRQWALRGWAGRPAGLALERMAEPQAFPRPLVKVKSLSLGPSEEKLLKGEYPQHGQRAIGHNAVLEVLQAGTADLRAGSLVLPVAALGCGDASCPLCRDGAHGVLGIGCDGYGLGVCTTPQQHLLPIPDDVADVALLADPLAALMAALGDDLAKDRGPVWIAGRTVEAALAAWLAEDAGRPVHRVDRRYWPHEDFPVAAVDVLAREVREGIVAAPTLAVDFTGAGSGDVVWVMANALVKGSTLYVRNRPPGIPQGIHWHTLPAAAPNRASLACALAKLQEWQRFRNLAARVGPALPLDMFWDVFLPAPFSLSYLEDRP